MRILNAFVCALVAALVVAGSAAAQTRPDLSGVWTPTDSAGNPASVPPRPPVPPGGGPPPPPPPPQTISITITQSATELRVTRLANADGREVLYDFTYKLDGAESVNQMGTIVLRTKAAWEGEALVLSSAASVEEKPIGQVKEVYRLENRNLVVDTTRHTPAGVVNTRTVHRKG